MPTLFSLTLSSLGQISTSQLRTSQFVAVVALFGALSIVLTVISNLVLIITFVPPVNYLLFDFGEIPTIICLLAAGPKAGFSAAVIEWLALNLLPTTVPIIGPLFKLASVLATLLALWIGVRLTRGSGTTKKFVFGGALAAIVRAAGMTIPNALLLILLFHMTIGPLLNYYLLLTAIFNALQIAFDLLPVYAIMKLPQMRATLRKSGFTWFEK